MAITRPPAARASAIYEGTIVHRRFAVRPHTFSYRLAMVYVDLEELPSLLGGALLDRSLRVVRFERSDYLGDPRRPLIEEVRDLVEAQTGGRPAGPIRLLTQLRAFGHCFNPISIYYCMAPSGPRVQVAVAEVTNTPWGERVAYVLDPERCQSAPPFAASGELAKRLHVSPFIGLDQVYGWTLTPPSDSLLVRIDARSAGCGTPRGDFGDSPPGTSATNAAGAGAERPPAAPTFQATLAMRRAALTKRSLARMTARFPVATLRVLALIYVQAAKLRAKGVPVCPHPPGVIR